MNKDAEATEKYVDSKRFKETKHCALLIRETIVKNALLKVMVQVKIKKSFLNYLIFSKKIIEKEIRAF